MLLVDSHVVLCGRGEHFRVLSHYGIQCSIFCGVALKSHVIALAVVSIGHRQTVVSMQVNLLTMLSLTAWVNIFNDDS